MPGRVIGTSAPRTISASTTWSVITEAAAAERGFKSVSISIICWRVEEGVGLVQWLSAMLGFGTLFSLFFFFPITLIY